MKKVKIMLTALAVVAVVGGALAFKAKTFDASYCQGDTQNAFCLSGSDNSKIVSGTHFYTPTTDITKCALVTCPNSGDVAPE
jgi:hypothetical protein